MEQAPHLLLLMMVGGGVFPSAALIKLMFSLCCEDRGDGSLLAGGHSTVVYPSPDSSSLSTILVPPHLGSGCPWEPQGAVAALPKEKPLPRGGGPCFPLLVSIRGIAICYTFALHPHGTAPCPGHCVLLLLSQLALGTLWYYQCHLPSSLLTCRSKKPPSVMPVYMEPPAKEEGAVAVPAVAAAEQT